MLDFDDIRKEVAIRHNVLLGKDDPILVTSWCLAGISI